MARHFGLIPKGVDIVVTHTPPAGCGAGFLRRKAVNQHGTQYWEDHDLGSRSLRDQLLDVRPGLVVCGHIHSAHGQYDLEGIPVFNVAAVNRDYELVRGPREVSIVEVKTV
jgi:Icc-related predicted phosphoesterase